MCIVGSIAASWFVSVLLYSQTFFNAGYTKVAQYGVCLSFSWFHFAQLHCIFDHAVLQHLPGYQGVSCSEEDTRGIQVIQNDKQ